MPINTGENSEGFWSVNSDDGDETDNEQRTEIINVHMQNTSNETKSSFCDFLTVNQRMLKEHNIDQHSSITSCVITIQETKMRSKKSKFLVIKFFSKKDKG